MKKITFFVIAGLTFFSMRAYSTNTSPFQVVVPSFQSGIEVKLEGLYFQPTTNDLLYSIPSSSPTPTSLNENFNYLTPNYDLGFKAALSYIIQNTGNDLQIGWTHFNQTNHTAITFPYNYLTILTDSSQVQFQYNAIDLDVGQYLNIGTYLQTRFFIGLRGSEIKNNITNSYEDNPPLNNDTRPETRIINSQFIGMGPRIGIDLRYHIGSSFSIVGDFATALLVGNIKNHFTDNVASGDYLLYTSKMDSQRHIVPALDGKLGVNYVILFKNKTKLTKFNIEAGYQITQYVNVLERFKPLDIDAIQTSSVGFNGPYLSLNFTFH